MSNSSELNPRVWKAFAGGASQIPPVGSKVYYFPEGHAEQASSDPDLAPLSLMLRHRERGMNPHFICKVVGVRYLADRDSDEVYARIKLLPIPAPPEPEHAAPAGSGVGGHYYPSSSSSNQHHLLHPHHSPPHTPPSPLPSFSKVLTASDANNGGGFSVPRFCAETVFPPLDYTEDPPLQTVTFRDVHGTPWDFRHIYRGTPRRHLLTTGWSKFVNAKKLIAGDIAVFVQKAPGELYIGTQRAVKHHTDRGDDGDPDHRRRRPVAPAATEGDGFIRTWRGRVPPENVVDAILSAEEGAPFEVIHYPKAGAAEFVVKANLVEAARQVYWHSGLRVRMAVEADESAAASRTAWHQGTVTNAVFSEPHGPWPPSMWRMLQVSWDEPDLLHAKNISPWQVEITSATPQIPPPYHSSKRLRTMGSDMLSSTEDSLLFPIMDFPDAGSGCVNPSSFGCNTFPAGMQGARQDAIIASTLSTHVGGNSHVPSENSLSIVPPQNLNPVSTHLNFWTSSQSESSSPPSRNSVFSQPDLYSREIVNSEETKNFSFHLFGVLISLGQPSDSGTAENSVADKSAIEDPPIMYISGEASCM